ncbi:helix-turn-helix domain-containing protein [Streptomyces bambusae]|uniref:Helix-turn-helix domain-containing protein n=1 Tax=Streptomyces bambusae TaxID=1550616 RepID=A0ABS6ZEU4_9ACTN|nr:helix-turn-helix transcriptional regulator [Streptomyces bambusae]MBW5485241.1 helix-turn-helix domain-containing protein [Streptomyces bambusae]
MGRSENPVDYTVSERGHLASQLREFRSAAELTYEQLSLRSGLSPATLKRAAAGKKTPTETTVVKYIEACGGTGTEIAAGMSYWRRARVAERGLTRRATPSPALIGTEGDLSQALVNVYQADGAPSLREMQRRAGKEWLALSSASRIINRQALPTTPDQMRAFLRACNVPEKQQKPWLDAWNRVVGPGRFAVTRTERLEKWRQLRNSVVHGDAQKYAALTSPTPSLDDRSKVGEMWHRLLYESFVTLDYEVFGKHVRTVVS